MKDKELPSAIRQARQLKEDLEEQIVALLDRFAEETGLHVDTIDTGEISSIGKGKVRYWVRIEAKV